MVVDSKGAVLCTFTSFRPGGEFLLGCRLADRGIGEDWVA